MSRTDPRKVRRLIREACEANDCPEISNRIIVTWSKRYTRCFGTALYRGEFDMKVTFSEALWPRCDERQREIIIVHEACHLISDYLHGGKTKAHGQEWKRVMRKAGYSPDRCISNVDTSGIGQKKYNYTCGCSTFKFGAVRHRKAQAGGKYHCPTCKGGLKLIVS